jgi:hypothetical protein
LTNAVEKPAALQAIDQQSEQQIEAIRQTLAQGLPANPSVAEMTDIHNQLATLTDQVVVLMLEHSADLSLIKQQQGEIDALKKLVAELAKAGPSNAGAWHNLSAKADQLNKPVVPAGARTALAKVSAAHEKAKTSLAKLQTNAGRAHVPHEGDRVHK